MYNVLIILKIKNDIYYNYHFGVKDEMFCVKKI